MHHHSNSPIGIFDSGIGGLTVASAITKLLPNESMVYFGDTAHYPWGDKSTAAIQAYSIKICDMLLQQNCKIIMIACNTASAAAYDLVREYVGKKAIVMNVIDPMVNHIRENYAKKNIGLIGTKQTVSSNIYKKKLDELNIGITLNSLATPLLVPLIEEGYANHQITADIIQEYLAHATLQNIDALILGCTHYPLIKRYIQDYYQNKTIIIDSADMAANALKGLLTFHNLLNLETNPQKQIYVSDYTDAFVEAAQLFFPENIQLKQYPLWD